MLQTLKYWLLALRPKTLSISVIPILTGSVLGWAQGGSLSITIMLVTLCVALLIQIGTNLHNDASDYLLGGDDPATRLGPARATAAGWLPAERVRRAALLCFAAAFIIGLYLVAVAGGWRILALGVLSIIAGYLYTGGPKPVAYTGTGELFVLFFFGLVAVLGSSYLQSGRFTMPALLCGLLLGLPAAGVLVVNNHRDRENDRRAGRNTIAVRYGDAASHGVYALCLLGPFLLLPLIQALPPAQHARFLPWLVLPWAGWLVWRFRRMHDPRALNPLLAETALFQLVLGLLLSASLLAGLNLAGDA
jgi:1,4-dihydroxy-2-naphthoate octaprenyltransferase